jgi:hypothetical protein
MTTKKISDDDIIALIHKVKEVIPKRKKYWHANGVANSVASSLPYTCPSMIGELYWKMVKGLMGDGGAVKKDWKLWSVLHRFFTGELDFKTYVVKAGDLEDADADVEDVSSSELSIVAKPNDATKSPAKKKGTTKTSVAARGRQRVGVRRSERVRAKQY